ncbi:hypothetical protein A0H76_2122 [Hepatospora eriocheir]|uniref:Uncharacterized protein n=1 Tax=Hepatospora eriocheir TaxID=1081669 RepID=A0A1X0QG05_9MICR|nr:hypothetical protein A0H76_2122 [Hepatospora eriocheir]
MASNNKVNITSSNKVNTSNKVNNSNKVNTTSGNKVNITSSNKVNITSSGNNNKVVIKRPNSISVAESIKKVTDKFQYNIGKSVKPKWSTGKVSYSSVVERIKGERFYVSNNATTRGRFNSKDSKQFK